MSRRNKGSKNMTNENQSVNTGGDEEQTSEVSLNEDVVQPQPEQVSSEAAVEEPQPETTLVVAEPVTPTPQEVRVGTVVKGTSSPLGKGVDKETARKILAQPSKLVAPTLSKFEQRVQDMLTNGDSTQVTMVSVLRRYVEEMDPKNQVDVPTARTQQRALWNTINSVMNTEANFRDNWKMVLAFFRNYRNGTLGDKYVNRFMDMLTNFNNEEKQAFLNVLALISVTVTTDSPKNVHKFIVLDKALVRPIKPEARQRLINFYA